MKLNWNFQRGGGPGPFRGGGMDIFWNYTIQVKLNVLFNYLVWQTMPSPSQMSFFGIWVIKLAFTQLAVEADNFPFIILDLL